MDIASTGGLRHSNPLPQPAAIPIQPNTINLDAKHAHEDPSATVLKLIAERAGRPISELQNFKLEKGFKPKGTDKPIEIFAYSNPPGPQSYYLVRHWNVSFVDPDTKVPTTLHFTKKIYTTVEVPSSLDGGQHARQHYMAALAARTYAKVEESRITFGATGEKTEIYKQIELDINKIANDRFITMEFFRGKDNVIINPQDKKDFKNVAVNHVRLNIRVGNREYNKLHKDDPSRLEGEEENNPLFSLSDEVGRKGISKPLELHRKSYVFIAGDDAPEHERKVAAILNKDDILADIIDRKMPPKDAFENNGVTPSEIRKMEEGRIEGHLKSFYSNLKFFSDKKAVNSSLMEIHGKGHVSETFLNQIAPDKEFKFKNLFKKDEPKDDLLILNGLINEFLMIAPKDAQKKEIDKLLTAYEGVYKGLLQDHQAIKKVEKELLDMGFTIKGKLTNEREAYLIEIDTKIKQLRAVVPPIPVEPTVAGAKPEERLIVSESDSESDSDIVLHRLTDIMDDAGSGSDHV